MRGQSLAVSFQKVTDRSAQVSPPRRPHAVFEAIHPLLRIQQEAGNRAVLGLLESRALWAKMAPGTPRDYKREADRVSAEVARVSAEQVSGQQCRCDGDPPSSDCAPEIVQQALGSQGQPLDKDTRAYLESQLGHDFSHVRVYIDAKASASARAINALAYTIGRDIVFGEGQYSPETTMGRQLLAHELAHVVQQKGTPETVPPLLRVGNAESAEEREADLVAEAITHRQEISVAPLPYSESVIRRNTPLAITTPGRAQQPGGGPGAPRYRAAEAISRLEEAMALATRPTRDMDAALEIVKEVLSWFEVVASERQVREHFGAGLGHGPRLGAWDPLYLGESADLFISLARGALENRARSIRLGTGRQVGMWRYDIRQVRLAQKYLEILTDERVSFELEEAMKLPDVPTQLTNLLPAEMHVLSWLRMYQGEISGAEREWGVNSHAIAGAIAWEALENIRSSGLRAVGPGKVHATAFVGKSAAEQVEESGAVPNIAHDQRERVAERMKRLATAPGAIKYIGAIMRSLADIASKYGFSIYCDAPLLADVYQRFDPASWDSYLKKRSESRTTQLEVGNPMGLWVRQHGSYLDETGLTPACHTPTPAGQKATIQRKAVSSSKRLRLVQQRSGKVLSSERAEAQDEGDRQFWLSLGIQPDYGVLKPKLRRTPMMITGNQEADEILWTLEAQIVRAARMRNFLQTHFGTSKDLRVTADVKEGEHSRYRKMDVVPVGTTTWEELAAAAADAGFWVHAEDVTLGGVHWPKSPKATGPHLDLYLIRVIGDFPLPSDLGEEGTRAT